MSEALTLARAVLAGEEAWLVGGAVRDQLLGRDTDDIDLAIPGDPKRLARKLGKAAGGASFQLSGAFGAWRVVGPEHAWHVDLVTLRDDDIDADLAYRDFTINAMAEPLQGGELLDPHGGRADLERRLVRMVSAQALEDDPLRSLRAIRIAVELDLEIDPATGAAVSENARGIARVAPERVFAELKRVINADAVRRGLAMMAEHGLTDVVLPELSALEGIEQSHFHHADVHDHTLEVLDQVAILQRDPDYAAQLAEPLSDELTRGQAMRWAALLHDAAKPQTRDFLPDGRVTFLGHDVEGAKLARDVLGRLRSSQKLRDYVAALVAHHLDAGFLVHQRPLDRRTIWRYVSATRPYSEDITLFTVADRLATRGRNAEQAIKAHLEVARELIDAAREPVRKPLVRGDELAQIAKGPRLGEILAQLEEDRFAGVISTREEALARAKELGDDSAGGVASQEGLAPGARPSATRQGGAIGLATRADAPAVLRIINVAYDTGEAGIGEPGWARTALADVERMIDAAEIAVLRQDDGIVGAVRVRRLDAETAELGMLSVDPAAMGTGAGRALLAFAEQHHGTPFMQLELLVPRAPHAHKQRLHAWYSRLGYVQISEREFDEPLLAGPTDMRTYRKSLRAAPAT